MKILIVEDNEERIKWFQKRFKDDSLVFATIAKEALDILANDLSWDCIFLDHDLANYSVGADVAKFLYSVQYVGQVIIHSVNPCGAKFMKSLLPNVIICPFTTLILTGP